MHHLARTIAVLVTLALCSAAQKARAVDLSGCWEGCWASHCTPHKGPLKAEFVKQDDTHYCVHFQGRFFKLLPFKYSVMLEVVEDRGDQVTLAGSHYLGRMMGTFSYTASATDCNFTANYSSCKDNGVFKLSKVGCCCE
jgi:hypothetical protein